MRGVAEPGVAGRGPGVGRAADGADGRAADGVVGRARSDGWGVSGLRRSDCLGTTGLACSTGAATAGRAAALGRAAGPGVAGRGRGTGPGVAVGRGPTSVLPPATGAAGSVLGTSTTAVSAVAALPLAAGAFGCSVTGSSTPFDVLFTFSVTLRTTGASMVEDAERTNSPISFRVLRSSLLSSPSSFASS